MLVTDTHSLLYHVAGKTSRLGRRSRKLFEDADNSKTLIYVPTVVLWELTDRIKDGSLILPERFDQWCRQLAASGGYSIEPLYWEDINEARSLPFKDPFDCLITGTALRLNMPLITREQAIIDSGLIVTLW